MRELKDKDIVFLLILWAFMAPFALYAGLINHFQVLLTWLFVGGSLTVLFIRSEPT